MKKLLFTILICLMLTHSLFWTKEESPIQFDPHAQQVCETLRTEILKKYCFNATPLQDSHPELYKFAQKLQKDLGLSHVPILFLKDNHAYIFKGSDYNNKNDLIALTPTITFDHDCLTDTERFKAFLTDELFFIKRNWSKDNSLKSKTYEELHQKENDFFTKLCPEAQPLKKRLPKHYDICKKIQTEMNLQDVSVQFLYSDIIKKGTVYTFAQKTSDPINAAVFTILMNSSIKQYSISHFNILIHHELTHIIQILTQSEGVGYKKGIHNNNCGSVPLKNLKEFLVEQAADAASLDHCICFKCLQEFSLHRKNFLSAMMNQEGYCVSPSGYLSKSEILEYADEMQRTYGQEGLCAEHRSM